MCEQKQNNKGKQCARCISRRINGKSGEINCSLEIDKYLKDEEVCGTYKKGDPIDDYKSEYGEINIDELINLLLDNEINKSEYNQNTWTQSEINKLRFMVAVLYSRNKKLNKIVEELKYENN